MIYLKTIQSSFHPTKPALFHRREHFKRRNLIISFCQSSDSDSQDPPPEGDTRKQELLARIAMLQAEKVRLTDYLDERSAYLSQFAEEANAEINQIGENALKQLDEAGDMIMENLETQMQAFEESAELNKLEIERNEQKLADFQDKIEKDRNEGLFFKNLGPGQPVEKANAQEEMKKIKEISKENAGSEIRRNIYLALICLVAIEIVNAFITSSSDSWKVAVLGAILVGLFSQLIYEQRMLSETESKDQTTEEKEE